MIGIRRPTQTRRGSDPANGSARPVRGDPVVDDLEVLLVEALGLGEVLREPLRDRDVDVRQRADGAVGDAEPASLAELVEAVLRGEPKRHARHRPGELAVDVRVDEMRVQDAWPNTPEVGDDLAERDGIHVRSKADRRRAGRRAASELPRELPRAGLVLVEHEEPDVPAALAKVGQELQQVRLRAGDARDLLGVEYDAVRHETTTSLRRRGCHAPTTAPSDSPPLAREGRRPASPSPPGSARRACGSGRRGHPDPTA